MEKKIQSDSEHIKCRFLHDRDKDKLDLINKDRLLKTKSIVWDAYLVVIRIFFYNLSEKIVEGVVDIETPVGDYNNEGFLDDLEGEIIRDKMGGFRLVPRNRKRDMPSKYYPIIEQNLLEPIAIKTIEPFERHVYGKGFIYKIADFISKTWVYNLEEVVLISPFEYRKISYDEIDNNLPNHYEKLNTTVNFERIDLDSLIINGENERCEFKSSLRWDYEKNEINTKLQYLVIKTIVGFLNTKGGILLIGIDDKGQVVGIEKDINSIKKRNADGFKLTIDNLISQYIGKGFHNSIEIKILKYKNHEICAVRVEKSLSPAFYKENNKNLFFIRSQSSTLELDAMETHNYILEHH